MLEERGIKPAPPTIAQDRLMHSCGKSSQKFWGILTRKERWAFVPLTRVQEPPADRISWLKAALVHVDWLSFVIVDGMFQSILACACLRGLVCFKAQIKFLFARAGLSVVEPAITQHQVVVRGNILWVDSNGSIEPLHSVFVVTLEEKNSTDLIEHDPVFGMLLFDNL